MNFGHVSRTAAAVVLANRPDEKHDHAVMAAAIDRFALRIDARHVLGAISAPTLVVHRSGDPIIGVQHARYLAEHIRGARLMELPGKFHFSGVGNDEDILDEIEEF